MKLIVLIKEVPDTYGDRTFDAETGLLLREDSDKVLDEVNARAIEFAVSHAEMHPEAEVVLLSAGPESLTATLRRGLALGATSAVHIHDDRMHGADLTLSAQVLAKAIGHIGFDLVIAGNQSTDGNAGVLPAMIAEHLAVPHATGLRSVAIVDGTVQGERLTEEGAARVRAALPAVVSITDTLPEPRIPNFKGLMSAKKKPIQTLTLADLGVDPDAGVPRSIMISVAKKPQRMAGIKIVDAGDAGRKLAEFLMDNRLIGA